jgi:chromatin assembly factor 1 subunit A
LSRYLAEVSRYITGIFQDKENLKNRAARAKKEKRDGGGSKSQASLANYFGKSGKPKDRQHSLSTQESSSLSSSSRSDFEKAFKPFLLKKDAELAPLNWFLIKRKGNISASGETSTNAILVDDGEALCRNAHVGSVDTRGKDDNLAEVDGRG